MYKVDSKYYDKIYDANSQHKLKVIMDGVELDGKYIKSLKLKDECFDSENFTLGSACIGEIAIEIDNDGLLSDSYNEFYFVYSLALEDGTEQEIPIGYYYAHTDDIDTSDEYLTKLVLKDKMYDFDKNTIDFSTQTETGQFTRLDLVKLICDTYGIELATQDFLNCNKVVKTYDNSISIRTWLSFVSERAGGFAKIGRDNKLYIKSFGEVEKIEIPSNMLGEIKNGVLKTITGVSYKNAIQNIEKGTNEGAVVYLSSDNYFGCDDEEVENIYNSLKGIQFQTLEFRCFGDPAIDAGDIITSNGYITFCQKDWEYGNGFYGNYKSCLNEVTNSIEVVKVSNAQKSARMQALIDEENEMIRLLNNKVTSTLDYIRETSNPMPTKTIQSNNNIHIEDARNKNALEYIIEGKCEQEETTPNRNLVLIDDSRFRVSVNAVSYTIHDYNKISLKDTANGDYSNVQFYVYPKEIGTYTLFAKLDEIVNLTRTAIAISKYNVSGTRLSYKTIFFSNSQEELSVQFEVDDISDDYFYVLNIYTTAGSGSYTSGEEVAVTYDKIYFAKEDTFSEYIPSAIDKPTPDYPSEIKSVGYQNFFDHNYFFENYVMYGTSAVGRCVYQLEPNTNYRVSTNIDIGTAAAVFVVSGNSTTWTPNTSNNGVLLSSPRIVTTDENGYLTIGMYVTNTYAQTLVDFENETAKIQISKGVGYHNHIPYSKYGIEVKSNVKNFFDYITYFYTSINGLTNTINEDGSITVSGRPTVNHSKIVNTRYINDVLENDKVYTISSSNDSDSVYLEVQWRDKITDNVIGSASTYNIGHVSFSVDLSKYNYVIILTTTSIQLWGTESKTITAYYQLEEGDTVTSFEKYKSDTKLIVLDEPLRSVSDIKDTYNLTTGVLTKRIGKVVLNGSESGWYEYAGSDTTNYYNNSLITFKSRKGICSHFEVSTDNSYTNQDTRFVFFSTLIGFGIYAEKDVFGDLVNFKTWLSENPVTVYYALANEETIELAPIDIELQKGINNISLLSNVDTTTSLLYYQDREEENNLLLESTPKSHGAINKLKIKNFYHHKLYPNMTYPSEYTYPNILNFYTLIFSNEEIKYVVNLPVASAELENKVYNTQAIGGKYYRCVNNEGTYEWTEATDIEIQEVYINSPVPLNTVVKDGVLYSDEIFIEENNVKIIQNIGLVNNEWEPLSSPITHEIDTLTLPTFETDTYITLKYFDDLDYYAMYLIKNDLTSIFSTQAENVAELSIMADKIASKVSQAEFNTAIEQTAKEIALRVMKDEVIASINMSPETIQILANRLEITANDVLNILAGNQINLKSKNISITSDNFSVDASGNMVCNNANVSGKISSSSGSIGGWTINANGLTNGTVFLNSDGSSTIYTVADLIIIRGYIMGTAGFTLSSDMINHYDLNGDGIVDATDYVKLQNLIGISMN